MYNKTSAALMLHTIMVLMDKQNSSDASNFPSTFNDDAELERCYSDYGCFSKSYPWTENRPDNFFPAAPEAMGIRYAVFTRRNRKIPLLLHATDSVEKIQGSNLDSRGPFYFISHGFLEGGHKTWIQNMADALLNLAGNEAASVAVVDWRGGSQPPYGQAVANIRLVGVMTAHLIHKLAKALGLSDLDNFHFIGHSLGAHLGGYCGHALQKRYNLKLGRITGLDPAAPYFSKTVTLVRLDRSDAAFVDVIHTNAMPLYFSGFGISEPIGHVDFYPNGGSLQPGCRAEAAPAPRDDDAYRWAVQYVGCNHERSYEYFTESVAPSCPFMAVQCASYESFLAGNCSTCDNRHFCIPMGYHSYSFYRRLLAAGLVDTNSNIALYSMTGSSKPYCRVHYLVTMKVSNSTESRAHGPDMGRVSLTLIDRNNNKSDHKFITDEQKYYKPAETEVHMVAFKDTGHPPLAVVAEWKYETNLFNPVTWRLLKSPSVYLEYLKLSSLEYNTDITVCPKLNKPVVANIPTIMKTKYCKLRK